MMRRELETAGWKTANVASYLESLVETDRTVDVWVDADGLVRRVVTGDTYAGAEMGTPDRTVTTTEYFDFGLEANIEAPPAEIDSAEWLRITEKQMRKQFHAYRDEIGAGISPLPGGFEPTESVPPASCLD